MEILVAMAIKIKKQFGVIKYQFEAGAKPQLWTS
jgi:hypothetical protein